MSTVDFLGTENSNGNEAIELENEKAEKKADEEATGNVSETGNSGRLAGKRPKADMSQTFGLFSKYFRERGRVGGFGTEGFGAMEGEGDQKAKHLGLFLKQSSFGTGHVQGDQEASVDAYQILATGPFNPAVVRSTPMPTPTTVPDSTTPAQLTIFYSGTVNVYDGIPAEKAQAIMLLAAAAGNAKKEAGSAPSPALTRVPSLQSTSAASQLTRAPSLQSTSAASQPQVPPSPNNSLRNLQADLPIARRHSLQRFLEKRRDRLVSKAPYERAPGMNGEGCFSETSKKQELPLTVPAHLA